MPISSVSACSVIERKEGRERAPGDKFMSKLWLGAGAEDGSVYVWSANGLEEKWDLAMSHQYVRSAPIKCLQFDSVHNTMLVGGWSTVKIPAVYVYSIPSFACIAEASVESPSLVLYPKTRLQFAACLEDLRVETLVARKLARDAASAADEGEAERARAEIIDEEIKALLTSNETEDEGESEESGSAPAEEEPEMAVASPTPFPRKMPQEIHKLISKLKSKPPVSGPQPRQVPKVVIKEVCSTSGSGAPPPAPPLPMPAPKPTKTLENERGPAVTAQTKEVETAMGEKPERRRRKKKKKKEARSVAPRAASSDLAQPRLCSTAMLRDKIETLENASFDPSKSVVGQCEDNAVKDAMVKSNVLVPQKISSLYNGLAPIVDKVPGKKPRKVPKQVDPSWSESIKVKPKIEDCWRREERVPQICELEVKSVPDYLDLVMVHSRIAMM